MRKHLIPLCLSLCLLLCAACADQDGVASATPTPTPAADTGEVAVVLSDDGVTVDGETASTDAASAVYVGADIVYYESGHDETYGEGTEADEHDPEEAAAHTVVTITQPGTYRVSGTLSQGQLAIDLGEEAEADPEAVVTLILDGVDITCTVAPAVIFYNVYECGSSDTETASPTVDTSAAGANVVLADGSVNTVQGSYVARIYEEGTTDKLHKYDGAFYSKMSMNIGGEAEGTGEFHITADNEGLDSELHLTINGGKISIEAQNDGINTNEDGVSVTTLNGGSLYISAGLGAEGDGIDSNGYLVINGGKLVSIANGQVGDGGIDSDSGIYLNGGEVLALGSRNDEASTESQQLYLQLSFAATQPAGAVLSIQDPDGNELLSYTAEREFSSVTYSSPSLAQDTAYSLWIDGVQQQYTGNSFGMGGGTMGGGQPGADGQAPGDFDPENLPEGVEPGQRPDGEGEPPEGSAPPDGGTEAPEGSAPPDGGEAPERPQGGGQPGGSGGEGGGTAAEPSTEFTLTDTVRSFSGISDTGEESSGETDLSETNSGSLTQAF